MSVWPESITVSRIEIEIKSKKVFVLFCSRTFLVFSVHFLSITEQMAISKANQIGL